MNSKHAQLKLTSACKLVTRLPFARKFVILSQVCNLSVKTGRSYKETNIFFYGNDQACSELSIMFELVRKMISVLNKPEDGCKIKKHFVNSLNRRRGQQNP